MLSRKGSFCVKLPIDISPGLRYNTIRKNKGDRKMKDLYQRARSYKGYARRDVKNKTARSRIKVETRKEIANR
jgi:hypothetical protein